MRLRTLRARLLIAVLASVAAVAGGAAVLFFGTASQQLDRAAAANLEAFERSLTDHLDQLERNLGLALEVLVADDRVVELFAARDRQRLLDHLLPLYADRLRDAYDLTQFHFHLPPATSFLRLHRPRQFGDDLSAWRTSLILANRSQRPVNGIEVTRSGPGLKAIRPVFRDGQHIGSVELATSLDRTLNTVARSLDASYALGIEQDTWTTARCHELLSPIARRADVVFFRASESWLSQMLAETTTPDRSPRLERRAGRFIAARSFPIQDFRGRIVGEIVGVVDMSQQARALRGQLVKTLTVIALLALAIAFGVRHFIHNAISKPIGACGQIAEIVSEGDLRELSAGIRHRVDGWSSKEIDRLVEAFEKMIVYLGDMSKSAEAIAQGQLDGAVAPKSDRDAFGQAFSRMLVNLRRTIESIQERTTSLAGAADTLAVAGSQIVVGAEEQSASSQETSASMTEMAAQSEQIAGFAETLSKRVESERAELGTVSREISHLVARSASARSAADRTASTVERMSAVSTSLESRIGVVIDVAAKARRQAQAGDREIRSLLGEVSAFGREISSLVAVVDDLADQTNLLAVNAAIEAERAGAGGQGFAVIARSIRAVAERSKEALDRVSTTAEAVSRKTASGTELSADVIRHIIDSTRETTELVEGLKSGIHDQRAGGQALQAELEESQEIAGHLADQLTQHAQAVDAMAGRMDELIETAHHVALSTAEQQEAGRNVVAASAALLSVADQYRETATQVAAAASGLNDDADALAALAGRFRV